MKRNSHSQHSKQFHREHFKLYGILISSNMLIFHLLCAKRVNRDFYSHFAILCLVDGKKTSKVGMVQTVQPVKQDHSVIRQLLSRGARVPPIEVFIVQPKATNICSSTTTIDIAKNKCGNDDDTQKINKNFIIDLIQPEEKPVTDLNEIDLSTTTELFPEIGLPLPDLQDIEDVVTTETSLSPDYTESALSSLEAPTTPETDISVFSPEKQQVGIFQPHERRSPMQICSSSDSEAVSSPPPVQYSEPSQSQISDAPTIKSLLNRPPMSALSTTTTSTRKSTVTSNVSSNPVTPQNPPIPPTMEAGPPIPLSVLAMGSDEAAPVARMMLQQMEEEKPAQTFSPDPSSDEDIEDEPLRPVRRKWVKKAAAIPKAKRESCSVSSEQDIDDVDSEVQLFLYNSFLFSAFQKIAFCLPSCFFFLALCVILALSCKKRRKME